MSVAECQKRIDSKEFDEWRALHSIEPIGQERLDILFADLAYTIACVNGSREQYESFLRDWWTPPITEPNRQQCDMLWAKICGFFNAMKESNRAA